ncbi:low affinity immunoglobulin gamma Fc region receptor II-a-like isoform X2 [Perca flavescens]|uniref:low affinity immunoglobulin gamma Fc region receptor II-a-like isoform X2 n=1 Tax=Perca flavescens TaxID=8167 RepID=UPI00106F0A15|nr:low affinity immunoglobulin gamma Fc region receptor II-a-like isoform X2 [Perca flavescens]
MDVWLLLAVQNCYAKKADAAFPHIAPNKLQFFEYESISVDCELDYSSEWRVMKNLKEVSTNTTQWETTGTITIKPAFTSDSGEYWCENKEGERSNSVNITITASEVVLESPAVPVMEEESVSLSCKNKMAASNLPADFSKDGVLTGTGYKGNFIINNVSKSHQGIYKCSISGHGESPESWLSVRERITKSSKEIQESPESPDTSSTNGFPDLSILLSVVFNIFCVAVLLLVIGQYHCQKKRVGCFSSEMPGTDPVTPWMMGCWHEGYGSARNCFMACVLQDVGPTEPLYPLSMWNPSPQGVPWEKK